MITSVSFVVGTRLFPIDKWLTTLVICRPRKPNAEVTYQPKCPWYSILCLLSIASYTHKLVVHITNWWCSQLLGNTGQPIWKLTFLIGVETSRRTGEFCTQPGQCWPEDKLAGQNPVPVAVHIQSSPSVGMGTATHVLDGEWLDLCHIGWYILYSTIQLLVIISLYQPLTSQLTIIVIDHA